LKSTCWFWLLIAAPVFAQDPRGAITGRVADTSSAVVPGVSVRATNVETNVVATAISNSQGAYEILYLLPGVYKVDAELKGFKAWTRGGVEVHAGDRVQLDVSLAPGDVREIVEIKAEALVLESTTATVSQVMTSKQVSELPLRSGSVAYLFTMAPATIMTSLPYDGPWNVDQSSNISLAGGRATTVDFNVDGVSNEGKGGTVAFVPPPDMVQEVRRDHRLRCFGGTRRRRVGEYRAEERHQRVSWIDRRFGVERSDDDAELVQR
jgi:Carboxypeptidase regulatory-like domain